MLIIMMQAITEEPATEKLIQRAGEVCGFDTNKGDIAADVEAGSRTGDIAADVEAGSRTVKDKNPSATHGGWEEFGPTTSISHELKSAEDNENAGRSSALEAVTYVVETTVGTAQGLKDRIAMERIRCRKLKSVEQMEPIRGRKKRWKGKRQ